MHKRTHHGAKYSNGFMTGDTTPFILLVYGSGFPQTKYWTFRRLHCPLCVPFALPHIGKWGAGTQPSGTPNNQYCERPQTNQTLSTRLLPSSSIGVPCTHAKGSTAHCRL